MFLPVQQLFFNFNNKKIHKFKVKIIVRVKENMKPLLKERFKTARA